MRGSVSGTVGCEGVCEGIVKVFVISVNEMWGVKEM